MSTEINQNCSCKENSFQTNDCVYPENDFKNDHCKCKSFPKNDCPICPKPVNNELITFPKVYKDDPCFILTSSNTDINGNNWTELTINGSVLVPEIKPSIEEIDRLDAKIEIIRTKVIQTPISSGLSKNFEGRIVTGFKLIVEGLICVSISYVSKKIDQSMHHFHGKIPFSAYIVLPYYGTTLKDKFHVSACIEDIIIKQVCDGKVNLTTTFILKAIPQKGTAGEVCFEDCGVIHNEKPTCECDFESTEINGLCKPNDLKNLVIGQRWTEIFIPEILNVPCYKPPVEEIISVNSKVEIFCQKVIKTPIRTSTNSNNEGFTLTGMKLVIEGMLRQKITYVAKNESQSVHVVHFDVPISTFIVLDSESTDKLTDKFNVTPCIEDIFICTLNDKQIFKNTTLFFKAEKITNCNL
ncbi:MAG: DUF3794 domain-containing protein [Bacilli bacterium]|nr:DUF3794 domain-containing protein [Bacilli bacterium]